MCIYSIYRITNHITNKVYIGFSKRPAERWLDHQRYAKNGKNTKLSYSIRKHGVESFSYDIIYQAKEDVDDYRQTHTLRVMEPFFVAEYNAIENGYNASSGGAAPPCSSGVKRSAETRKRMSAAKKGKRGVPKTQEWKEKIASTMRGRKRPPFSTEWKNRMSESHKKVTS